MRMLVVVLGFEVMRFIENWGSYWDRSEKFINERFKWREFKGVGELLNNRKSGINENVIEWSKK